MLVGSVSHSYASGPEIDPSVWDILLWEKIAVLDCRRASTDCRRASCQLLMKEWALNTGKLPQSHAKEQFFFKVNARPEMTSAVYHGCKASNQTNKLPWVKVFWIIPDFRI